MIRVAKLHIFIGISVIIKDFLGFDKNEPNERIVNQRIFVSLPRFV